MPGYAARTQDHIFANFMPELIKQTLGAFCAYTKLRGAATNFSMGQCPEFERLRAEVENVLGNLAQVSTLLVELFRSKDFNAVYGFDTELELTVGQKERCIGALRQHIKDHNCAPPLQPTQEPSVPHKN